jgi:hypothetical protein
MGAITENTQVTIGLLLLAFTFGVSGLAFIWKVMSHFSLVVEKKLGTLQDLLVALFDSKFAIFENRMATKAQFEGLNERMRQIEIDYARLAAMNNGHHQ